MRRLIPSGVCVLAGSLLAIAPALAITNGQLDGGGHPSVGILLGIAPGQVCPLTFGCSAVLVAADRMITTAGCGQAWNNLTASGVLDHVLVNFDPANPLAFGCQTAADIPDSVPVSSIVVNPGFVDGNGVNDAGDVAVLFLNLSAAGSGYSSSAHPPATLPVADRIDQLPLKQDYTAVSFGGEKEPGDGFYVDQSTIRRRFSPARTAAIGPELQVVSLNTGGSSAACISSSPPDDGGPTFVGSTTEAVSLVRSDASTGCSPNGHFQRLDVASVRGFLADQGVPVP